MEPVKGRFTFWSEWEPQSEVQVCNEKHQAGYPRWLHTPRLKLEEIVYRGKDAGPALQTALRIPIP